MEQFEAYFQRADADRDGRISGNEAVSFFQATNLPKQVLAQIWTYADQNRTGFLGRPEFYNALKLVTVAQSKRDLTPDLVKAALYGPASAKIPAPQINLAPTPGPNMTTGASPVQLSGTQTSNQGIGLGGPNAFPSQPSQYTRPPRPLAPSSGFQPQPSVPSQAIPGAGSMSIPHRPDSLGGSTYGSQAGTSFQVSNRSLSSGTQGGVGSMNPPVTDPKPQTTTGSLPPAPTKPKEDPKPLSATGNGFSPDSVFGDVFSVTPSQTNQNATALPNSSGSMPKVNAVTPSQPNQNATALAYSAGSMPTAKPNAGPQPPAVQSQQFLSAGKVNPQAQTSSAFPVTSGNVTSSQPQPQPQWPRMTQSDVQKYNRTFVQVDSDKDGKITGEEARNLFLSWRLPREVLKQVWDLSDQDNDSMLSLKEFCIALYLMERYREGRPLPAVLPHNVIFDDSLLHATSTQPAAVYSTASWRPPTPGFPQQPQGTKTSRPPIPSAAGVGRPPRPAPVPLPDEPIQKKANVPELEKHLVDQLSTEEQDALNKKFQEAKDAEKKVADLEKDIVEAKQKIQFYHAKMQELILYKSRCDNRLNEITEKVVADKREADLLAKKYEEKYKQSGDVASKLSIEEATFRDIQEKKMELYRAIAKMEQDGDDGIQDRANQIQSDLEELVKSLNERCKTYGLRGKPTSLVELPFGWQPGIGGATADWDEDWDKFEDEGFTYVKELTLDVQNVIAPPKPKSILVREEVTPLEKGSTVKSPSKADDELENDKPNRSPSGSPLGRNAFDNSPSKELRDLRIARDMNGSPHAFDTQSEYGGAESVLSGDKNFEVPSWGSFDTHYDADAAWDHNPITPKEGDHDRRDSSLFDTDDWGLNPIKTGPAIFDSVPSTPLYNPSSGPFFDSVPSTPLYNSSQFDNSFSRNSAFGNNFADSVPSTPLYNSNTSPRRFSEGSEDNNYSFDSFSRFDSFNMSDSGAFGARDSTFSRFDSMRSTRDSEIDQGGYFAPQESSSLARFDSFRSTADSDYNFGAFGARDSFTRFDSMRSTRDSDYGQGFPSFDDVADPFGSSEPFRSSNDSQTPKKESDSWKAF